MKKTTESIVVKILSIALIVSVASAFPACKKKSKVPTREEFLKEHRNDPDPHGIKNFDFDYEDLIDAWGNSDTSKSYGASAVWKCGDKYIVVGARPDDTNKIEEMYVSYTQELVYLFSNASVIYVCKREDGVTDYNNCIMLTDEDIDEEIRKNLVQGSILQIEFDGYFLASYPGQVSTIYSAKAIGQVDESEIPSLQEQEKYIRDNYTGSQ
ncbi:MAG: hypothetical protein IKG93_06230 [Clostridiales bacterium]|nr:hypothetical protein [Clostridiales bacterium]